MTFINAVAQRKIGDRLGVEIKPVAA